MDQGSNSSNRAASEGHSNAIRLFASVAAIPALAIAYYFGVALPGYNDARLELERQQRADDRVKTEQMAKDADRHIVACIECRQYSTVWLIDVSTLQQA